MFPEAPEAAQEAGQMEILEDDCPAFAERCGRAVGVGNVTAGGRYFCYR